MPTRPWRGYLLALGCATSLAACAPSEDPWAPLLGRWEYRQQNPARPGGVDEEGERLEFVRGDDGALTASYFGLEREGEHGLFYTATAIRVLSLDEQGTVRLTVPARRLFSRRPASLAEAATGEYAAGFTKDSLRLAGSIENGDLVLVCSADAGACPERTMVFRKGASQ